MFGVILIFFFGIAPSLSRKGTIYFALNGEDREEKEQAKIYDFFARIGLIFVFIGFFLQVLSNFISSEQIEIIPFLFLLVSTSLVLIAILGVIFLIRKLFFEQKIVFKGQYSSVLEKGCKGQNHFWQFIIKNETKKRLNFEFNLPNEIDYWEVLQSKTELQKLEKESSVQITDLDPENRIQVRVWNMGSYDGKDAYLCMNNKEILFPKIYQHLEL